MHMHLHMLVGLEGAVSRGGMSTSHAFLIEQTGKGRKEGGRERGLEAWATRRLTALPPFLPSASAAPLRFLLAVFRSPSVLSFSLFAPLLILLLLLLLRSE